MTTDAATLGNIPQDLQHLRRIGLWARAVHTGTTYWSLRPNDSDGDQDHQPGILSQQSVIWRDVLSGDHNSGWWRVVGIGHGHPRTTPGLDIWVDTLTQAKRGEMLGRKRRKMDPNYRRIPPALHPGALTGLWGSPDTLLDQYPIILGDLNADVWQPQNPHSHQVADLMMEFSQMDLIHHVRKRWRFRSINMWSQVRQGRVIWASN